VGTGTWSLVSGAGTISNASLPGTTISNLDAGNNKFEWKIINGVCSSKDTVNVHSDELILSVAGNDTIICSTSMSLGANAISVGSASWTVGSVGTGSFIDPSDPNATVTGLSFGPNEFIWTITNGVCSPSTDAIIVTVDTMISAAVAGDDQFLMVDYTNLSATSPSAGVGTWSLVSGYGVIADPLDPLTGVSQLAEGYNTFRWTVSNGACNDVTDDVIIYYGDLIIPTAYSPNGDGKNDFFRIVGMENYENSVLEVYNRWGNKVFQSDNYQNEWSGNNSNGNDLVNDTYYYILKLSDGQVYKGFVALKR
jgi:gliding motility-associated-like protein